MQTMRAKAEPDWPQKSRDGLEQCGHYLEDELVVLDDTLAVYGSPWCCSFNNWGFGLPPGAISQMLYSKIPEGLDILVTHGPPLGRADLNQGQIRVGCPELLQQVQARARPRVHVFGHSHECLSSPKNDEAFPAVSSDGQSVYVNASTCDHGYLPMHPPIVFDLPKDRSCPPQFLRPSIDWDKDQVLQWLEERELGIWHDGFIKHEIDGSNLSVIDGEGLNKVAEEVPGLKEQTSELHKMVAEIAMLRSQHYR